MDRVAIFCDGANIDHGTSRDFPEQRIDHRRQFEKIVGPDRRRLRVYWYMAVPVTEPQASDSQRFISYLHGVPYVEVRHKKLAA